MSPSDKRPPDNPLAEVFGYPPNNDSTTAERHMRNKLCPYNNKSPNCTKSKAENPLGVCSIREGEDAAIICPVRFREDWIIAEDAAGFFGFEPGKWTSLPEVRLNDRNGKSAGNIDLVIVSYDDRGRLTNFGSLEVQAVYISGNVRNPFEHFMEDREARQDMPWPNPPRPDYLSSSRKRLMPQLTFKGGILKSWGKKQAVALHKSFYATLPPTPRVAPEDAEIAWFVYDLKHDPGENRYHLVLEEVIYTEFEPALASMTTPYPGPVEKFERVLQNKLDEELVSPPDAPTLGDIMADEGSD
jgi:hypothetical protein